MLGWYAYEDGRYTWIDSVAFLAASGALNKDSIPRPLEAGDAVIESETDPEVRLKDELYQLWFKLEDNATRDARAALSQMAKLMFQKKKNRPVPEDRWFSSAPSPGEQEQSSGVIVSEVYVLQQIKAILDGREAWLTQEGLPLWYEMPDGEVRQKFLTYCKKQFHAQEDQKKFQQRDLTATDVRGRTGPKLVRIRKKSRFDSERARRGGTLDIWRMISFTGACDPALLKELEKEPAQGRTGLAPTPWVTREAKEARKRLKYVLRLDNKQKQ